jgi:peptidyl-prolyl cis-trans isomerase SDCCAG10
MKPVARATDDRPASSKKEEDITKIREKHAKEVASSASVPRPHHSFFWLTLRSNSRKTEIEKMEAEIRSLAKRRGGGDSDDELEAMRKTKKGKSYLEEELARYSKGKGLHSKGKRRDEGDVLAALNSFRGKLANVAVEEDMSAEEDADGKDAASEAPKLGYDEDPGMEVDDDAGFMGHALRFPKDDGEESRKAERDYEVIDPRQRGARAKEEERERKRAMKAKSVRGGRSRY